MTNGYATQSKGNRMYQLLLSSHVVAAVASLGLFIARGILMYRGSPLIANRALKVVPRAVDTVLLATAVVLMLFISQYPFTDHWLTVKLLGLVVYIILGAVALGRGRTQQARMGAFAGGVLVFCYLYAVAITRDPLLIAGLG